MGRGAQMTESRKAPDIVIHRLPLYLRVLEEIDSEVQPIISSQELGERCGIIPAQIRKDLSNFGVFGKQGVGYATLRLRDELRKALRLDQEIHVGLIGAGNLGQALLRYASRPSASTGRDIIIVAAFDNDPKKIGRKVAGVEIFNLDGLEAYIDQLEISMIILTVPAEAAQEAVDRCAAKGIRAFLNFAPAKLNVGMNVRLQNADVAVELQSLAFYR